MQSEPKIIIILLGRRGAGKTTTANSLQTTHNYRHIEMSQIMKLLQNENNSNNLILRRFVENMHRIQSKYFAVKYLYENNYIVDNKIVVTGIRNIDEVNYFYKACPNYKIYLFYINCPFFLRYFRTRKRKDRNSFLQFFIEEYYSIKWGDYQLKKISQIISCNNSPIHVVNNILSYTN